MKTRPAWMLPIVTALALTACSTGRDQAQQGVSEFRARVSRGAFAEIHRSASPEFRESAAEDQFVRFMTSLDRKLGAWHSSSEPEWNVMRGTGGHIVRLGYRSDFAKGAATEQFAWRIENGAAVLLGYQVNSPLLVID